jgi:hypothetical protein
MWLSQESHELRIIVDDEETNKDGMIKNIVYKDIFLKGKVKMLNHWH